MANHRTDTDDHVAAGTWRADRHASRNPQEGAGVEHDENLWAMLRHWQGVFDAGKLAIEEHGAMIQSATQMVPNPGAKLMKEASVEIRALCQVLGIGALNRARLGAAPSAGSDEDAGELDLPPLPERGKRVPAKV